MENQAKILKAAIQTEQQVKREVNERVDEMQKQMDLLGLRPRIGSLPKECSHLMQMQKR